MKKDRKKHQQILIHASIDTLLNESLIKMENNALHMK
jgi:hypothetical protein